MTYDASKVPSIVEIKNNGNDVLTIKLLPNGVINIEKDSIVKYSPKDSEELLQIILAVEGRKDIEYKVNESTPTPEPPADPEITNVSISVEEGLKEGETNVEVGAVVATLSATGGTSPITYAFKTDATNGADNAKFEISGTSVKVKDNALTEGEYKISVEATDSKSKTKVANATISVATADSE